MNAAAALLAQTATSFTAKITWSQFVLTTTAKGKTSRVALDQATMAEAVEYAKNARAVLANALGADLEGCRLSREHGECVAVWEVTFDHESGTESWDVCELTGADFREATKAGKWNRIAGAVHAEVCDWMHVGE
jgi:hypothetical protein